MFPAERPEDEVQRVLNTTSYFDMLGLAPDTTDEDAIRRAYKQLSVRVHPDKSTHPKVVACYGIGAPGQLGPFLLLMG